MLTAFLMFYFLTFFPLFIIAVIHAMRTQSIQNMATGLTVHISEPEQYAGMLGDYSFSRQVVQTIKIYL